MELKGDRKKNGRKHFMLKKIDDKITFGSYDLHMQKRGKCRAMF